MTAELDFAIGLRPCGVTNRETGECQHLVEAREGYHYCPAGHLSHCRGVRTPDTAHVTAQTVWFAHDAAANATVQFCATHRPDGTIRLVRRGVRVRTDLKYGIEPMAERTIVFTNHARRQMSAEAIEAADVRSVVLDGELLQEQPGKFRYRGVDAIGRALHVVYRLNVRHEVVVIATFVERLHALSLPQRVVA